MAASDLIPSGRTSLVKKGVVSLQVQTEYAGRPAPRITTTILKSGQVIHKIERNLEKPVASSEEKNRIETTIRQQHSEVLEIIEGSREPTSFICSKPEPPASESGTSSQKVGTTAERLACIPGAHRVFRLDNEGNFLDAHTSTEFKKKFSFLLRNLRELISVFTRVPGVGINREQGVYELERSRLYLVSSGTELYFFYVKRPDFTTDYEQALKSVLAGGG